MIPSFFLIDWRKEEDNQYFLEKLSNGYAMVTATMEMNTGKFNTFVDVINDTFCESRVTDRNNVAGLFKSTLNKIVKYELHQIVPHFTQISIDQSIIQYRLGFMNGSRLSNVNSDQMAKALTKMYDLNWVNKIYQFERPSNATCYHCQTNVDVDNIILHTQSCVNKDVVVCLTCKNI